jgi:hypothetical protein
MIRKALKSNATLLVVFYIAAIYFAAASALPGCGKSAESLATPKGRLYVVAKSYDAALDSLRDLYAKGKITREQDAKIAPIQTAATLAIGEYRRAVMGGDPTPAESARWSGAILEFVEAVAKLK